MESRKADLPTPRPRRCGCDPLGELRRGLYGIGPRPLFFARILGIALLAAGGAVYVGLALRQFLTQTPITQYATVVRPLPQPDLLLCLDRVRLGLCGAGARTTTRWWQVGPGKIAAEAPKPKKVGRQDDGSEDVVPPADYDGLFGCNLTGSPWNGARRRRVEPRQNGASASSPVRGPTEVEIEASGYPLMPEPVELWLSHDMDYVASNGIFDDISGLFACHLFPVSRSVAGGTPVANWTRSYSVGIDAPVANRTDAEPGAWRDSVWAALVHPKATEAFLSGRALAIGDLDAYRVELNTRTTLSWTFAVDRTAGSGDRGGGRRDPISAPGGEFYAADAQRQAVLRSDFRRGYLRHIEVSVVPANRPADTLGGFVVVQAASVYTFTALDVVTSVGAMITWMAILYRALFGQGRLQPLGLVQVCLLRGAVSERMGERYGKGYDPEAPAPPPAAPAPMAVPAPARQPRASLPPPAPPGKKSSFRAELRRELASLRAEVEGLRADRDAGGRRIAHLEAQDRIAGDLYMNRWALAEMLAEAGAPLAPGKG
ncbi:hypothetical protein DFJ74DRAFT_718544 [Hyaloraphidium curvatum]|nr:hypothetical protein DFJ74DRAFT_718544 [Hyaloraphidium curvatum]